MRPAAQEMELQQPVGETKSKGMTKQKPQVSIRELRDSNCVFVEVHGHRTLAQIELQTIAGDLICAQFVNLYKLPVLKIERNTLATAIKGCKGNVDKTCEAELNWGGYEETSMIHVPHVSGSDMILRKPALQEV